jgi:sugar lactone lactonase YvrE
MRTLALAVMVVVSMGCGEPAPETCRAGGTGTIIVTSTGLPMGRAAAITVSSEDAGQALTASQTLNVSGGGYLVETDPVATADTRVRTAYGAVVSPGDFCLRTNTTQSVSVTWSKIPSSNRVWMTSQNSPTQLLGFDPTKLAMSSTVNASVASRGPIGGEIVFDREGNLWTLGGTTSDATLVRFKAADLATPTNLTPDTQVDIDFGCVPLARGLAFDEAGNLWVSSPCRDGIFFIEAKDLKPQADVRKVTPSKTIAAVDPFGLVFDAAGNLWVASSSDRRLLRFDKASLSESAPTASLQLGVFSSTTMGDTSRFSPSWLAFDLNGDLWANDFGANVFYRVPKTALAGTGMTDVQPAVRLFVSVDAVLEGFAFDESGALWSPGAVGKLIRFGPSQLATSSSSGTPTMPEATFQSPELGSGRNIAIYPAPAASPLFHRLP